MFFSIKWNKRNIYLCESEQLLTSRLQYVDSWSSNVCFCYILDLSSSSLNNENTDVNFYTIDTNYEKIDSINKDDANKRSKLLLLSSIENNDEGEFLLLLL